MLIFVSLCATKSMGLNEGAEGRNPIAHNDSSRSICLNEGAEGRNPIAHNDLELGFFLNSEK